MSRRRLTNLIKRRVVARTSSGLRRVGAGFSQWASGQFQRSSQMGQGFVIMAMR